MKNIFITFSGLIILSFSSCKTHKIIKANFQNIKPYHNLQASGKIYSALYQQRSAEYRALCQQAFNIAKFRLDEAIPNKGKKPIAIITDIDETLLDNSYYAVEMAKQGKMWSQESWANWTSKGSATPLQGSLEFLQYAASKGVNIFYVTNRTNEERIGTLANLKKYKYPLQGDDHLILRNKESSKENRRQNILEKYDIVLYLGDNLTDFSSLFDNHISEKQRSMAVETLKKEFGKRFIILPNTGYGDWESAVFDYKNILSQEQKDSIIYNAVDNTPHK